MTQHSACTRVCGKNTPTSATPAAWPLGISGWPGRLVRDCLFRGHGAAFTLGLWGHVCAGEDRYIKPYKPRANLLLDTTHTYEVCLWRTVLDTMPADPALTATQARQLASLREKFAAFPALSTALVPQNSMLREFIGE